MEAKELTCVVKNPKILTGLKRQGVNEMTRNKVSREELRRESMPQRNGKEERFKENINGTSSKVCCGYENNSYSKQEADRTHKFTSKDKADVTAATSPVPSAVGQGHSLRQRFPTGVTRRVRRCTVGVWGRGEGRKVTRKTEE
jgi:hypothetical protein